MTDSHVKPVRRVRIGVSKGLPQIAALVVILLINSLVAPNFFSLHMQDGRLFGSLIDILNRGVPVALLALGMTLVMGAAFGALMGWIIDTLKLPAFIIMLAGMFFVRGMSFIVSQESIPIEHPVYQQLAGLAWSMPGGGRLTFLALIMLMTVIVGMVVTHRTCFGHRVYAIGGNITSAELMGCG